MASTKQTSTRTAYKFHNSRTDDLLCIETFPDGYIPWCALEEVDSRFNNIDPDPFPEFYTHMKLTPVQNKQTLVCLLACLNQKDYDMAMNTIPRGI